MTVEPSSVVIFTDGACSGNPGPGGWGSIVSLPDGNIKEIGGGDPQTTNNRMEMTAAIRALAAIDAPPADGKIIIYTDSTYLIKGITQWVWGWRSRGWKSAEGKDVANRDLWEDLLRQTGRLQPAKIQWRYVRGHAGYPGNERCDQIAVSFAASKPDRLYIGPRDGYFVDLSELPLEESLPERSSGGTTSGGKGYGGSSSKSSGGSGPTTYLSYHNGVVMRHSTWTACEKRVKGQSGAKFKKAKSSTEERDILVGWGLDPAKTSIQ